jgi:hypothetical protein
MRALGTPRRPYYRWQWARWASDGPYSGTIGALDPDGPYYRWRSARWTPDGRYSGTMGAMGAPGRFASGGSSGER